MKRQLVLFLFVLVGCLIGVTTAVAAGVADAKARMRARVGELDQLKIAGNVGENNRGFLEVRKAAGNAAAVVAAENKDRTDVFSDTASRTGSTSDAVGRTFAKQIAGASAAGVWIQGPDGEWRQKR